MSSPRSLQRFDVPVGERSDLLLRLGIDDTYLDPAWVASATVLDPGEPVLLHSASDGGDIAMWAILRSVADADGATDITTPYGYGGPIAVGDDPPLERFWEAYGSWCAERGVVATFVRFHPRFDSARWAPPDMRVTRLTGTVAWHLHDDVEERMHRHHRRVVRRARAAGVEVRVTAGPSTLDAFVPIYELTMRRQEASAFYFFPDDYWSALVDGFGHRLVLSEAVLDGRTIAAALSIASAHWMHYHLGASADEARSLGAFNLCLLETARWAHHHGCSVLHLGGGVGGGEDSLLEFKRRFDPESAPAPFAIGAMVNDAGRYRELCGGAPTDGYFPAYRRPAG